ncbi:hypothetical protein D3C81_190810 [compost metagenome]
MNKLLNAYSDVDTLYDFRRGLIQKWLTRGMQQDESAMDDEQFKAYQHQRRMAGDNLWELHIERNYKERRMDTFDYPFCGMKEDVFLGLYKERSLTDWGYGYYPTNFFRDFVKVIIDQEGLTDKPIAIRGVMLHVNVHPYVMDEEAKESLKAHILTRFGGRVDVTIVDFNVKDATPNYYKQFDYVFRYGMLLYEENQLFFEQLAAPPIPNTTFLVPDILLKQSEHLTGTPYDILFAQSLAMAHTFKTVPIKHQFYDYAA